MITRLEKKIPVWGDYDVVVAGGGIAGVAAALAAARSGVRTCLLERFSGLGGLATMGHVIVYLPLCDGFGRQVSFGLAEELLRLPMRYSSCRPSGAWQDPSRATNEQLRARRYELRFDPAPMALGLERLLYEAGVTLMYETLVVDVVRGADNAITHLVVENKSGCGAIKASAVVDATGDADICHLCGEPEEVATNNSASAWYYAVSPDRLVSLQCGAGNYNGKLGAGYDGTNHVSVTEQLIKSRELILADLEKVNAARAENGQTKLDPFYIPFFASFRMTRHLVGDLVLEPSHVHQWFDDAVGIFSDWRKPGPVFALPWRALHAATTPNLLTAGRCISSTGDTWDVTRVIPVCAVSGEAAGAGAALAVQTKKNMRDIDTGALQTILRGRGVRLDPELVKPARTEPSEGCDG